MKFAFTDGHTANLRVKSLRNVTAVMLEAVTTRGGRRIEKGTRVTVEGSGQRVYLYPFPRPSGPGSLLCILKVKAAVKALALEPIKPSAKELDPPLDLDDG